MLQDQHDVLEGFFYVVISILLATLSNVCSSLLSACLYSEKLHNDDRKRLKGYYD